MEKTYTMRFNSIYVIILRVRGVLGCLNFLGYIPPLIVILGKPQEQFRSNDGLLIFCAILHMITVILMFLTARDLKIYMSSGPVYNYFLLFCEVIMSFLRGAVNHSSDSVKDEFSFTYGILSMLISLAVVIPIGIYYTKRINFFTYYAEEKYQCRLCKGYSEELISCDLYTTQGYEATKLCYNCYSKAPLGPPKKSAVANKTVKETLVSQVKPEAVEQLPSSKENTDKNKDENFCSACGAKIALGDAFCDECGAPQKLPEFCNQCGFEFVKEGKFCPKCGTKRMP